MKKKVLLTLSMLMCFVVIGFAGCGSSETADEEKAAETKYPIVLEDNDYFTFEITGYDDMWGEHKYKITNKLDQDVAFDGEKAIINGDNTVDAFIYCDLAAGTSGKESFYLDDDQLSDYEDGEEITMTIQYKIYDENTFEDITSGSFDYVFKK